VFVNQPLNGLGPLSFKPFISWLHNGF